MKEISVSRPKRGTFVFGGFVLIFALATCIGYFVEVKWLNDLEYSYIDYLLYLLGYGDLENVNAGFKLFFSISSLIILTLFSSACTVTWLESKRILKNLSDASAKLSEISSLNYELGDKFVDAIDLLLKDTIYSYKDVDFVASHGQTIWHDPKGEKCEGAVPSTFQIGEPSVISYNTGIRTIPTNAYRLKTLKEYCKQKRMTILSFTHDLDEAIHSDRLVVINEGKITPIVESIAPKILPCL